MAKPTGRASGTDRKQLDDLGARIESARQKLEPKRVAKVSKYKTLSVAWRMIVELVVGVAVGGSIGYALDWAFGTLPLMLIVFGGFGFAAGIKTMVATSRTIVKDAGNPASEGDGLG